MTQMYNERRFCIFQKQQLDGLEREIEEREGQLMRLQSDLNQSEASLHQAKGELAIQRRTTEELESQVCTFVHCENVLKLILVIEF